MQEGDIWLYVSTALLGLLIIYVLNRLAVFGRPRYALPAPPGLPLLGHALTLTAWRGPARTPLLTTLRTWAQRHGGAFQLRTPWLGRLLLGVPRVVVVLSDPVAVHSLLALGETSAVKSRRHYNLLDSVLHSSGVPSTLTCSRARYVRRLLRHAFVRQELLLDGEVVKAKSGLLAERLLARGPGAPLEAGEAGMKLGLDVVGEAKLGYDFQALTSTGDQPVLLLRLLGQVAGEWEARRRRGPVAAALAPWLSDGAAEGGVACQVLQAFVEQELWADIAARGPPPPDDVTLAAQLVRLQASLPSPEPPTPSPDLSSSSPAPTTPATPPPHPAILAELAAQLVSATTPTGLTLAWTLYCMAGRKSVQDKLVAELKREGAFAKPETLSYEMLPQLSYLDCVVREVLRLYPPLPCPATVRTLKKDVTLTGGLQLASGSEVWVDVFSMHRSTALWRDPDNFNPERWSTTKAAAATECTATTATTTGACAATKGSYDGLCTVEPDPTEEEDADGGDAGGTAPVAESDASVRQTETGGTSEGSTVCDTPDGAGDVPLCSPNAFMPFGSGIRCCLGQQLAVMTVKMSVAVLLCFLVFERAGAPNGMDSAGSGAGGDGGDPHEGTAALAHAGLFLRPAGGLRLMVAPRKRA